MVILKQLDVATLPEIYSKDWDANAATGWYKECFKYTSYYDSYFKGYEHGIQLEKCNEITER